LSDNIEINILGKLVRSIICGLSDKIKIKTNKLTNLNTVAYLLIIFFTLTFEVNLDLVL